MKTDNFVSFRCLACLLFVLTCPFATHSFGQKASLPNIIYIQADDLGWSELGCFGNRFNETPAPDLLARQGVRFTQAYI